MRDALGEKLEFLGLSQRGVLSPLQKLNRAAETRSKRQDRSLEQDGIKILTTTVAGASHIRNIEVIAEMLPVGDVLTLMRDPENEFDSRATVVLTSDNVKLGFLPRSDNEAASSLLDAGKSLFARVTSVERRGRWPRINIDVYMRDR